MHLYINRFIFVEMGTIHEELIRFYNEERECITFHKKYTYSKHSYF